MTEDSLDTFRSSTLGWLRGTLAGWGTILLFLAGIVGLDPYLASLLGLVFAAIPASPPGGDALYEEVKQGFEQEADASAVFGSSGFSINVLTSSSASAVTLPSSASAPAST